MVWTRDKINIVRTYARAKVYKSTVGNAPTWKFDTLERFANHDAWVKVRRHEIDPADAPTFEAAQARVQEYSQRFQLWRHAERQRKADRKARREREHRERRERNEEYRRWIGRRFSHLSDAYRALHPSSRYRRSSAPPFHVFVFNYVGRNDMDEAREEIAEKRRELGIQGR